MAVTEEVANEMVPVTILTGFLGAGKTTLLKRILTESHGHKIAVIENEFGPESIDNEILVQDNDEQIIELSNGCVCCTVRGDLLNALTKLKDNREQGKTQFDRVILETTGMANPGPVCQTFFMDDEVATYYRLDSIITVVDAKHGMETLDKQTEAQSQVGFADRILVSKKDLVTEDEYQALRQRLVHINPRAHITPVHFGEADIQDLLNLHGFNLNTVLDIDPDFLKQEHADHEHHDHDHGHGHECGADCNHEHHHHHHHHDDSIGAFVFTSDRAFDPVLLEDFLGGVVQVYGPDLYRYKGILYIQGIKQRMLLQGVHMMIGTEPGKAWQNEKPYNKIVFIGHQLPKAVLLKGLEQCLAK
ncbi:CobW family GTP-binding protein [Brackiella oedipodis]|uniref:CobW family GTP-binding protein n=1 Tax=Brackiella oedipodis TaxID=124225 RepID=UPI00048A4673|nr:GTP-binding protein [Brackiella oedipodis]